MSPLQDTIIRALRRVLRRQWVAALEMPLPSAWSVAAPFPSDVVIRRGMADDAVALRGLFADSEPPERRLARGDVLLVAEMDGRLIGCNWLTRAPLHNADYQIRVTPRPHELYGHGLYVVPEARGRGVGMALRREIVREAQRLGAQVCVYHVWARDPAIIAWHEAAGAILREWSFDIILLDRFRIPVSRRPGAAPGPRASPHG